MSYRSIKRVLGETSLERKCRFLFGASLLLLICGSFWWYGNRTETLVNEQNRNTGRLLVVPALLSVHWHALAKSDAEHPNWVNLVPQFQQRFATQHYEAAFISRRDGAAAAEGTSGAPEDQEDRIVLEQFLSPAPPEFREQIKNGIEYVYYQPIRAVGWCLQYCHTTVPGGSGTDYLGTALALGGTGFTGQNAVEGDLLSVGKITISNAKTQESINKNRGILIALAIVTVFLAMVAAYAIVRYVIVKPLRHLRDVSDAISHGNTALRADIHTGDEFEDLAVAFNRMLRHLVTAQDELRQVNANLDGKVDELAQVNMRLYEMNTIKSDFLATMSHELRTPLNSILGFSEVLGSIDLLNDKQKRYVQNIQKSGRMLLEMINDILDLAKIESGKMEIRLSEFSVEQVIGAQCDMARPLSEKKNIDLETRLQSGLPPMYQDQARVQQVLNNLLSNAIKFTPEGGRITVAAERDAEEHLVLQISDTGVGIAEDDQQTIFEKFRQGRTGAPSGDAMTREYSGTGLGLSIVKELCKLLGGGISVRSELGKGSTFTVRLPWRMQEQPRLDSALVDGFDSFARPLLDLTRNHTPTTAEFPP